MFYIIKIILSATFPLLKEWAMSRNDHPYTAERGNGNRKNEKSSNLIIVLFFALSGLSLALLEEKDKYDTLSKQTATLTNNNKKMVEETIRLKNDVAQYVKDTMSLKSDLHFARKDIEHYKERLAECKHSKKASETESCSSKEDEADLLMINSKIKKMR